MAVCVSRCEFIHVPAKEGTNCLSDTTEYDPQDFLLRFFVPAYVIISQEGAELRY